MEKNNTNMITGLITAIVFIVGFSVLGYYIYKKYSPAYRDNRGYDNRGELVVSPALHPYNQCLSIIMNESRKNQELIKADKARELCLEMVKPGEYEKKVNKVK